ncbi:MAG: hypothetical protein V1779_12975 [bacterium]
MRKILILSFLFLLSCVAQKTVIYQLNTKCNKPVEEVFKSVTGLLVLENLNIDHSDVNIGYISASTTPNRNYKTGYLDKRQWLIQFKDGKITAQAKVSMVQENAFGATILTKEVYYNDQADQEMSWYWNVRNALESLCDNKIEIIERQIK